VSEISKDVRKEGFIFRDRGFWGGGEENKPYKKKVGQKKEEAKKTPGGKGVQAEAGLLVTKRSRKGAGGERETGSGGCYMLWFRSLGTRRGKVGEEQRGVGWGGMGKGLGRKQKGIIPDLCEV